MLRSFPPVLILKGTQPFWALAEPIRANNTPAAAENRISFKVLVLILILFPVLYLSLKL